MKEPRIPHNEQERQTALNETGLLQSGAEARFDRITRTAQALFSVPISLISLIDQNRQWFKSCQGLSASETPRNISFCGHAILQEGAFLVEDTLNDTRFQDNPLVCGAPYIRFYAGIPLQAADGYRIGTLCIIDIKPRKFSAADIQALTDLAATIEELIAADAKAKKANKEFVNSLKKNQAELTSLINNMPGVTYRCLPDENWTMLYISGQVDMVSGYTANELIGNQEISYGDLIHPEDAPAAAKAVADAKNNGGSWHIECRILHKDGEWRWVEERGNWVFDDPEYEFVLEGFIIDITREKKIQLEVEKKDKAFSTLSEIAYSTHRSLQEKINHALHLANAFLNTGTAIISEIDADIYKINWINQPAHGLLKTGDKFPVSETWCYLLTESTNPLSSGGLFIHNASQSEYSTYSCAQSFPVGTYIGIPIHVEGHHYGTLNFTSAKSRSEVYDDTDKMFVRLLANWLSDTLTMELTNRRFAKLIHQLPGTVYQFRRFPDGRVTFPYSSESIYQLYGITSAEAALDATPAFARIHPNDLEQTSQSIEDSAKTMNDWQCTYRVGCEHSGYRWVSGRAAPELLVDGSILWHGFIQDVHEQELARQQLINSEERLRSLFNFSPIGIALNDYETGLFIDLNQALLAPTGYTREEFVELSYFDVTPIEYMPEEKKALEDMQTKGRYGPFEKEYIRKDGSRYPVRLQGIVSTERSGRKVIWSLIEDITERKKLDTMKDQFVATVSHELRTPLTSIRGSLDLLAGGAVGQLPEKGKMLITNAQRNAYRLSNLINDLLDMEKLVAGKEGMTLKKQPLGLIIDEVIESMQNYRKEANITIKKVGDFIEKTVNVDEKRLAQALRNLISNAVKFSPENGHVEVSVASGEAKVCISIRDDGPGVPAEFQQNLFQRFAQADSSDTRKLPGTGLGLSITREIITQLGGRVYYQPAKNGGSEFIIELPVSK